MSIPEGSNKKQKLSTSSGEENNDLALPCSGSIDVAKSICLSPLPAGVYPTMITPFQEDGKVDYECLDMLTEWYITSGSVGLFSVCQSSEMYNLADEERLLVAKRVVTKARGRVPVLACGTFPTDDMPAFITKMGEVVNCVVLIASMLAKKEESDHIWIENVKKLLKAVPNNIPLGIYECPKPYHRILAPETVKWLVETNRFIFYKDTSRRRDLISAKLNIVKNAKENSPFNWFNGNVSTLYHSLGEGAHGFSGCCASYYPWMTVSLVKTMHELRKDNLTEVQTKHLEQTAVRIHRFLSISEQVVRNMWPASAKGYLAQEYDLAITPKCRAKEFTFYDEMKIQWTSLKAQMEELCQHLNIKTFSPRVLSTAMSTTADQKAQ